VSIFIIYSIFTTYLQRVSNGWVRLERDVGGIPERVRYAWLGPRDGTGG